MSRLNQEALERLVLHAMAAGVAAWADRLRQGLVPLERSLLEAFGDTPAEFLQLRADLLEELVEP